VEVYKTHKRYIALLDITNMVLICCVTKYPKHLWKYWDLALF
jgi:hypothetical protein